MGNLHEQLLNRGVSIVYTYMPVRDAGARRIEVTCELRHRNTYQNWTAFAWGTGKDKAEALAIATAEAVARTFARDVCE